MVIISTSVLWLSGSVLVSSLYYPCGPGLSLGLHTAFVRRLNIRCMLSLAQRLMETAYSADAAILGY